MSEEILKALMQLFALVTKQDRGIGEKEIRYVEQFLVQQIGLESAGEYLQLYQETAREGEGPEMEGPEKEGRKLTSVLDSVKVLKLCKKISKTINQRQKVVVLVRMLELVNTEYQLTEQRLGIITTAADIFKISKEEYRAIFSFVTSLKEEAFSHPNHLLVSKHRPDPEDLPLTPREPLEREKRVLLPGLDAPMVFLRVPSVELYFMKYTGEMECQLNGLGVHRDVIYLFASGSVIRMPMGAPILYSDISSRFLSDTAATPIHLEAEQLNYVFPGKVTGLRQVSFEARQGNLVGIMGSSGSGKTTLMNVLSGMYTPSAGKVLINGIDLHQERETLKGVCGLVPQDDLLVEELSVYDNLYFNAKFCFRDLSEKEIREKVHALLESLGLMEKKDLRVGSVMNKTISGGQRKRLNIALELIREPSILFLDEPTSGLSSRDSENVMDLLREQSMKGSLVFVVIHQPSSDLYKMFDRVVILDSGGHMVYYGNPVEAVIHFKEADQQVNAGVGECPVCGNVNPELIFNIIEAQKVDEYGNYTGVRKVSPLSWELLFQRKQRGKAEEAKKQKLPEEASTKGGATQEVQAPEAGLHIPGWFSQWGNYFRRDLKSKLNNTQYLLMMLLVSPVLAFILAFIVRYKADPSSELYLFRENENIPIYIFMALIVALFLGLIVSAEEIFGDRKILKRERFLNLSRSSYLLSKISILVLISALQSLLFVLVANNILEIRGMAFAYWFALFSTAVCANMLGLIISATFNSAVTIYIVIPLVMIPMMVLSGAMFSFEKLNRSITAVNKVPLVAELMPTKWSYEALMVHQFKANRFQETFYDVEKRISMYNFKSAYLLPELEERLNACIYEFRDKGRIEGSRPALEVLANEVEKADPQVKDIHFKPGELSPAKFNEASITKVTRFLKVLNRQYLEAYSMASKEKERLLGKIMEEKREVYFSMLNRYHNESVADRVKKIYEKNQIVEDKGFLHQQIDPVFMDPQPEGWLGIRSHFYAPRKYFMGRYMDTYRFNMGFIWFLTVVFYLFLYFDLLGHLGKIKWLKGKNG